MNLIERAARRLEELAPPSRDAPCAPEAPPVARHPLDLAALRARGLAVPGDAGRLTDEFRILKRPLIANAARRPAARAILVASALAGDGKTFTAANLALSLAAEREHTVLLVDADVARPALPGLLGLPPAPGLMDLLQDPGRDPESFVQHTSLAGFSFLPAGTPAPHATELLASAAMARVVEALARPARRILVFDSPPVNLTSEAHALAAHMGQALVVVQAESTPQSEVMKALSALEACPVRLLVLNQAHTASQAAPGYGYAYPRPVSTGAAHV